MGEQRRHRDARRIDLADAGMDHAHAVGCARLVEFVAQCHENDDTHAK